MQEKGSLSVNTENLMPIIKKWLYSDKDIFLRELVSNACDAISKRDKLAAMSEAEAPDSYRVEIRANSTEGTLTISDNGLGMTADEVRKYINQVAFSGAYDFIEKYESQADGRDIIGHFGLGFYSAFMVAEKVVIQTLSYRPGAEAVRWESDGSSEYELSGGSRTAPGTDIILYIDEDSREFLEEPRLRSVLNKYCSFLPRPVFLCGEKEEQINDCSPLWLKKPSECSEEEYKSFYSKVFADFTEPLFWIHLNVDYPFNLKGILYFPRLSGRMDNMQGEIKLYNNQVYVADNIKEVIPEFLMLLKGVIDCPDMPLNVSRSFLQNDGTLKKIRDHITKKVSDRLCGMFDSSREEYEKCWQDIGVFIKYGCMREEKFCERIYGDIVFNDINGDYYTLSEYLEKFAPEKKIYYVTNAVQQAGYISLFKENGLNAVILDGVIDQPFINFLESKEQGLTMARIDADIASALKGEGGGEFSSLCEQFKLIAGENTEVSAQPLKAGPPAILLTDEQTRRFRDMSKYYGVGMENAMPGKHTLVLNSQSGLIQAMDGMEADKRQELAEQLYDLAYMTSEPLTGERMDAFLKRSARILEALARAGEEPGAK